MIELQRKKTRETIELSRKLKKIKDVEKDKSTPDASNTTSELQNTSPEQDEQEFNEEDLEKEDEIYEEEIVNLRKESRLEREMNRRSQLRREKEYLRSEQIEGKEEIQALRMLDTLNKRVFRLSGSIQDKTFYTVMKQNDMKIMNDEYSDLQQRQLSEGIHEGQFAQTVDELQAMNPDDSKELLELAAEEIEDELKQEEQKLEIFIKKMNQERRQEEQEERREDEIQREMKMFDSQAYLKGLNRKGQQGRSTRSDSFAVASKQVNVNEDELREGRNQLQILLKSMNITNRQFAEYQNYLKHSSGNRVQAFNADTQSKSDMASMFHTLSQVQTLNSMLTVSQSQSLLSGITEFNQKEVARERRRKVELMIERACIEGQNGSSLNDIEAGFSSLQSQFHSSNQSEELKSIFVRIPVFNWFRIVIIAFFVLFILFIISSIILLIFHSNKVKSAITETNSIAKITLHLSSMAMSARDLLLHMESEQQSNISIINYPYLLSKDITIQYLNHSSQVVRDLLITAFGPDPPQVNLWENAYNKQGLTKMVNIEEKKIEIVERQVGLLDLIGSAAAVAHQISDYFIQNPILNYKQTKKLNEFHHSLKNDELISESTGLTPLQKSCLFLMLNNPLAIIEGSKTLSVKLVTEIKNNSGLIFGIQLTISLIVVIVLSIGPLLGNGFLLPRRVKQQRSDAIFELCAASKQEISLQIAALNYTINREEKIEDDKEEQRQQQIEMNDQQRVSDQIEKSMKIDDQQLNNLSNNYSQDPFSSSSHLANIDKSISSLTNQQPNGQQQLSNQYIIPTISAQGSGQMQSKAITSNIISNTECNINNADYNESQQNKELQGDYNENQQSNTQRQLSEEKIKEESQRKLKQNEDELLLLYIKTRRMKFGERSVVIRFNLFLVISLILIYAGVMLGSIPVLISCFSSNSYPSFLTADSIRASSLMQLGFIAQQFTYESRIQIMPREDNTTSLQLEYSTHPYWKDTSHMEGNKTHLRLMMLNQIQYFQRLHNLVLYGSPNKRVMKEIKLNPQSLISSKEGASFTNDSQIDNIQIKNFIGQFQDLQEFLHSHRDCYLKDEELCKTRKIIGLIPQVSEDSSQIADQGGFIGLQGLLELLLNQAIKLSSREDIDAKTLPSLPSFGTIYSLLRYDAFDALETNMDISSECVDNAVDNTTTISAILISVGVLVTTVSLWGCLFPLAEVLRDEMKLTKQLIYMAEGSAAQIHLIKIGLDPSGINQDDRKNELKQRRSYFNDLESYMELKMQQI